MSFVPHLLRLETNGLINCYNPLPLDLGLFRLFIGSDSLKTYLIGYCCLSESELFIVAHSKSRVCKNPKDSICLFKNTSEN